MMRPWFALSWLTQMRQEIVRQDRRIDLHGVNMLEIADILPSDYRWSEGNFPGEEIGIPMEMALGNCEPFSENSGPP